VGGWASVTLGASSIGVESLDCARAASEAEANIEEIRLKTTMREGRDTDDILRPGRVRARRA
jgi:hypothetical protein